MAKTFKFPVPREERIVLLTAALATPGLVATLVVMLANIAASGDVSLLELFDQSRALRASFAGMLLIYVSALYGLWAFSRVKDGSRLEVGDTIRFSRPGAPLTGWFARDVSFPAERVDRLQVDRVRRGTVERVEVLVGAGREEIAVNLEHCVAADVDAPPRRRGPLPRAEWAEQPLVTALAEATGVSPQVG